MKASLFAELRRRNVLRMAGLYLVGAWLITQVSSTLLPGFDAPPWVLRVIVMLLAIGFVPALVFAWVYEITPEGVKRESEVERHESITPQTARRMDRAIMAVLALALVVYAADRLVLVPRRDAAHDAAMRTELAAQSLQQDKSGTARAIPEIESDPSIAVLPLVNMSDDKANEFFSDGISEELLNLLAKVPKLRVIARTSSFAFKGKEISIPEIARELRVASVLEGSVRKSADKVRITAQLIRASDGSHLWSDTYDRTLDDIFKVQDEIAAAVVAQLKIKLLGAAPTAKPVDPKAYPLILQAQALLDQQSRAGREQAASVYRQALAIAPNEARAWAGLSRVYVNQVIFAELPTAEGVRLIKEAANKALATDPDNVITMGSLARVAADFEFDLPAAARFHQRALELEPGNLVSLNAVASMLLAIGRLDEARRLFEYRLAHDPANPTAHYNMANLLYSSRQWDAAIDEYRAALRLSPEVAGAHSGVALALLADNRDAAAALKEAEAEPDEVTRTVAVAMALHGLGRSKEADAALKALVDKFGQDQPESIATVHAYRGQADAAFEWLDKAVAIRDPQLASALTEPMLEPLHDDSRWLPFLRRIGSAPEQLAKIEFKVTLPQAEGATASGGANH
jgi:TolB-like protein/cytochrome c-type biogenesis protein CcmH/NrfG